MSKGTGIAGAMDYVPAAPERKEAVCFICNGVFKGGSSYAARCLPPLVQVCSAVCADDPRYSLKEKPNE